MRRHLFAMAAAAVIVFAAAAIGWSNRNSLASHPFEDPQPIHFVTLDLLEPKHGQTSLDRELSIRIQVHRAGTDDLSGVAVEVKLDDQLLAREGNPTEGPIELKRGEKELLIRTKVKRSGLHTLEIRTPGGTPWTNRTLVYFGTR